MKFNPNQNNVKNMVWATYIPSRKPNFKLHANRGQAISALKYRATYKKISMHKVDYNIEVIPEDCTPWNHNGSEWIEIEFEREYFKGQKGLVIK